MAAPIVRALPLRVNYASVGAVLPPDQTQKENYLEWVIQAIERSHEKGLDTYECRVANSALRAISEAFDQKADIVELREEDWWFLRDAFLHARWPVRMSAVAELFFNLFNL